LRNYTSKTALMMLCFIAFSGQAWAASIEEVRQHIEQFKQQTLFQYAPMTLARAEAYLGAAMLAKDSHHAEDEAQALLRSENTLAEARASAVRFQKNFSDLIRQRQNMNDLLAVLPKQEATDEAASPFLLMDDAEHVFKNAVRASEQGHLNESQNLAMDAAKALTKVESAALPYLEDSVQRTLSRAAMKGAKRSAPVTYLKAKTGLTALKAYLEQKPVGSPKPENLVQIHVWAEQALNIAVHVKNWRGNRGSYEMLVLQNQQSRQRIAEALHLKAGVDYSTEALVKAIQQREEQAKRQAEVARAALEDLKKKDALRQQQALQQLQDKLLHEKTIQLEDMKDAFRAKLERETFELKRQKRLRALFPEKGVSIIANLDGSLLVRLGILKFSSGSSKLDAKYFDLLGRLKEAMDIYGDRTFRIEGHTDSLGDVKENQQLSLHRAESVRDFLIAAGVDATSIKALGYGEVRPIASNQFAKGREMNRRIDVVIEARSE